jgi:hypothetical protein
MLLSHSRHQNAPSSNISKLLSFLNIAIQIGGLCKAASLRLVLITTSVAGLLINVIRSFLHIGDLWAAFLGNERGE